MSNNTEKIVDIRKYRRKAASTEKPPNEKTSAEGAVREMAHHMLMALQYARQLLH